MKYYFFSLTVVLYLICLPSFFLNWKKINHPGFNWIVVYTIAMCLADITLRVLKTNGIHNHLVMNVLILISCFVLLRYYYEKRTAITTVWMYLLTTFFSITWTIEMLLIDDVHSLSAKITFTLLSVVIMLISILSLINRKNRTYYYSQSVDTALLLYFGVTIVLNVFASFGSITAPLVYDILVWIQLCANFTYSIILIIGAWKKVEQ